MKRDVNLHNKMIWIGSAIFVISFKDFWQNRFSCWWRAFLAIERRYTQCRIPGRRIQQRWFKCGHAVRTLSSALFSLFPRAATCKSWLFEKRFTFPFDGRFSFPLVIHSSSSSHPAPGFIFVSHHKWLPWCSWSARRCCRCCCYSWILDSGGEHIAVA